MSAAKYDINADRGSSFKLFLEYQTSGSTGIDLNGYTADMQIRRSTDAVEILAHFTGNTAARGLTGGGRDGFTLPSGGSAAVGGIYLNAGSTGSVGPTGGSTGGIFVSGDVTTMKNIPSGRHFYDLEITATDGSVTRIAEGRFNVSSDITR